MRAYPLKQALYGMLRLFSDISVEVSDIKASLWPLASRFALLSLRTALFCADGWLLFRPVSSSSPGFPETRRVAPWSEATPRVRGGMEDLCQR